jgi:hypothetical protein
MQQLCSRCPTHPNQLTAEARGGDNDGVVQVGVLCGGEHLAVAPHAVYGSQGLGESRRRQCGCAYVLRRILKDTHITTGTCQTLLVGRLGGSRARRLRGALTGRLASTSRLKRLPAGRLGLGVGGINLTGRKVESEERTRTRSTVSPLEGAIAAARTRCRSVRVVQLTSCASIAMPMDLLKG